MDLFERAHDGLILCRLINLAVPDTIDDRALNVKEGMNVYHKTENINLALNAAKSIGCQVINIGAQDIIEGRPILILGLVWQIIKIQLLSHISLKEHPEMVVLLEEGEELASFIKLPPEQILLRWVNYHLKNAGSSRKMTNFGSDVTDSEIYSILLNQLNPAKCALATETDLTQKAAHIIRNAQTVGAATFIKPKDICDGNKKLNMGFVAQIFNACPGLVISEKVQLDLSTLEIDDVGDSREERVFRMWINSLNLEDTYINDLFNDLRDGVCLLRLIDVLQPGIVNWKKCTLSPTSKFKKVENANYVVNLGKEMKLSLVNVGGPDIVDGNKKLILAIVWQLLRKFTLQVLAKLASSEGVGEMSEERVVLWANERVAASGKSTSMRNFKDSTLKSSLFFLDLVAAIEPRAVETSLILSGESNEDMMMNAKYVISCSRKVGACVFLTPEDIVECKSKMLLAFSAALWTADIQRNGYK
jgi:plastin-1